MRKVLLLLLGLGGAVAAADAPGDFPSRAWNSFAAELMHSIGAAGFILLTLLVVTAGLAVDAFLRIRISRLVPERLLAEVQEDMANGEYEKAQQVCLESDSLIGQIFAAALAKSDHSFDRMAGAMRIEADILGLVWRQWIGQFRLIAVFSLGLGAIGALFGVLRLIAELPGRPSLGLAFASSFEMRQLLYGVFGSLALGIMTSGASLGVSFYLRGKLDRIMLESLRLGEELLDPFRPLPAAGEEA